MLHLITFRNKVPNAQVPTVQLHILNVMKTLLFNGLHICFTAESRTVNPVMTLVVVKPASCLLC